MLHCLIRSRGKVNFLSAGRLRLWSISGTRRKSFERHTGSSVTLTPIQTEIIRILAQTGGIECLTVLGQLKRTLTQTHLKREFATPRHMEKPSAEKRGG
ncbi:MAG: hypothetical protein P8X68_07365 [Desulfobacterales bacterium]